MAGLQIILYFNCSSATALRTMSRYRKWINNLQCSGLPDLNPVSLKSPNSVSPLDIAAMTMTLNSNIVDKQKTVNVLLSKRLKHPSMFHSRSVSDVKEKRTAWLSEIFSLTWTWFLVVRWAQMPTCSSVSPTGSSMTSLAADITCLPRVDYKVKTELLAPFLHCVCSCAVKAQGFCPLLFWFRANISCLF